MLAREHTQLRGASSAAVTRSVRGGVDLSPIAVPLSQRLQTQPCRLRRLLPDGRGTLAGSGETVFLGIDRGKCF